MAFFAGRMDEGGVHASWRIAPRGGQVHVTPITPFSFTTKIQSNSPDYRTDQSAGLHNFAKTVLALGISTSIEPAFTVESDGLCLTVRGQANTGLPRSASALLP